ncbi:LOW QUALITY PROTEIN: hypothetical protein PHMEG_00034346 [Phytophthora megakarya]|uniref:Uncharacterized protein n=1 Tax=Phytophthora megakarya TaxID=4795 RepID=A0A225UR76_9STRA|nr:LOW QUALITY PROTEIN: hypothetical protein PHMEG_00034346 [Phytophthora megakarya]
MTLSQLKSTSKTGCIAQGDASGCSETGDWFRWYEVKFTTWSQCFHAVGSDWNIPDHNTTSRDRKYHKKMIAEKLSKSFVNQNRLHSLVGVL